jgi:DNA helicase-2/ATP-dependent DNA helicase PcrA
VTGTLERMAASELTSAMEPAISASELAGLLGAPEPTAEQAAVIEAPQAPAVVIAGAGSGKTETMAARVIWLIANQLVEPGAVLGLTFTRKAAAELGSRIRRRLAQWRRVVEYNYRDGSAESSTRLAALMAGEPTVLTYAAYAGRLVGEHAMRIGAEPSPRMLSQAVRWQLADAVVRRFRGELPADIGNISSIPGYVLQLADTLADHLVTPEQVEQFCTDLLAHWEPLPLGKGISSPTPGETAGLVTSTRHRYELMALVRDFAAAKRGGVDFADQMTMAAHIAAVPEVGWIERSRYGAVLLDEYQDTGHAQVVMLRGLFGGGHPVTAVGDPFQSIYGWRGASAGNIDRFAGRFLTSDGEAAQVFPLSTSWRNDELILDAANAVAEPLRAQSSAGAAKLRARPAAGLGQLIVTRTETIDDEARWVAARLRIAWDALPDEGRTAAVLVRRRSQLPLLADALLEVGLPVEVVGLGGLLATPEIIDVVATLRVLADHKSSTALARLLAGARWRIGARDLAALNRRARALTAFQLPAPPTDVAQGIAAEVLERREEDAVNLVEALDDLGDATQYSPNGHRRLSALGSELHYLRRRLGAPLPELVAEVERAMGLDVEVAATPERAGFGRVHLDRFLDETARFAAESDEATLRAFLAFLEAAEKEENGLELGEIVVESERVQLLTVHGAKGLEWDVVAVPGLVESIFPAKADGIDWTRTRHELPVPLRGDHADLPAFTLDGAADRKEVRDRLKAYREEVEDRHAAEERRLAYVAFTRARHVLLASAYHWDYTQKPRQTSPFLTDLVAFAQTDGWAEEPPPDTPNPTKAEARTATWPLDPLGRRRADVEAGAALVRTAIDTPAKPPKPRKAGRAGADDAPLLGLLGDAAEARADWRQSVDLLLAEREQLRRAGAVEVALPAHLSVSQLVTLHRDPDELARRLRRPLPSKPAPLARRGTAFHSWLEQRWSAQALLDVDELPGAADETGDDSDVEALKEAFERSAWAARTPTEVEVGFEMTVGGVVVRGRMDAVFGDEKSGWTVVDWKTGARPRGAEAQAVAVQLAAYRLAWARIRGISEDQLQTVSAAFHYVRSGETVAPADLLDAEGLRELIAGPPTDPKPER